MKFNMDRNKPIKTIRKLGAGSPVTLVAIGDSLTYGWMVAKGYLDFLHELILEKYPQSEVRIRNRGIPGNTAGNGLLRLQKDVIESRPDCVLIQFALNDAFLGYSPVQFGDSIRAMVDRVEIAGAEIILVTSVWIENQVENRRALEFYAQLETIAGERKLAIAKVHEYWKRKIDNGMDPRKMVQADMVHPTIEGYRIMAEAVAEVFEYEIH
jgi:lysophospholipase L1-like esterase